MAENLKESQYFELPAYFMDLKFLPDKLQQKRHIQLRGDGEHGQRKAVPFLSLHHTGTLRGEDH